MIGSVGSVGTGGKDSSSKIGAEEIWKVGVELRCWFEEVLELGLGPEDEDVKKDTKQGEMCDKQDEKKAFERAKRE